MLHTKCFFYQCLWPAVPLWITRVESEIWWVVPTNEQLVKETKLTIQFFACIVNIPKILYVYRHKRQDKSPVTPNCSSYRETFTLLNAQELLQTIILWLTLPEKWNVPRKVSVGRLQLSKDQKWRYSSHLNGTECFFQVLLCRAGLGNHLTKSLTSLRVRSQDLILALWEQRSCWLHQEEIPVNSKPGKMARSIDTLDLCKLVNSEVNYLDLRNWVAFISSYKKFNYLALAIVFLYKLNYQFME